MSDLHLKTISELSSLLDAGEISSRDITTAVLASIEERDGEVKAYVEVNAEEALAQADLADKRRAAGEKGGLLGIPIGVKDVLNVEGQSCRCASNMLKGYTSPYDATVVAKLRTAGAVLLGRLNMDEFAMGSTTENSAHGRTRNPWDKNKVPGGSSGGSAAAVADDSAIATLGSDTGGSVRQPAAFCGCVGLKPTYGRVSRFGLTAYASSFDQVGPLTKTVKDAAILLQSIAGHDPQDSTSVEEAVPDFSANLNGDLSGMKLGIPKEYFGEGMDPEVEAAVRAAIAQCKSLGAEVVEVSLPHTEYAIAAYYVLAAAEASANLARFDGMRYGARVEADDPITTYKKSRAAGFGTEVKRRIILGTYVLSSGYYDAFYTRAQRVRTLIAKDFKKAFSQCDALLSPVAPTAAYGIGEKVDDPLQMYLGDVCTVPVNLAGICGLSVPCGFTSAGMPIGLQVIGPAFGEEAVLQVGHAYEQSTEWHLARPATGAGQ